MTYPSLIGFDLQLKLRAFDKPIFLSVLRHLAAFA
jgi:hypothetical protein